MKVCTKCGAEKPIEDFYAERRASDGKRSRCKGCDAAYDRRYRERNRERLSAAGQAWSERNREKSNAYKRAWNARNRDKMRVLQREWYAKNLERARAKVRASNHVRQARRSAGSSDRYTVAEIWERENGKCCVCGKAVKLAQAHIEHWIPFARGGDNTVENVRVAHPRCNSSKGIKTELPDGQGFLC